MAHEGEQAAREQNRVLEDFFAGADLLVHDAQYTNREYLEDKVGWGHSPIEHAISSARRAGVRQLALFHHDPDRSDEQLDRLSREYCDSDDPDDTRIFFAREGMEIEL
jgi:ribonuclease BN (tRNA processing enzyme)